MKVVGNLTEWNIYSNNNLLRPSLLSMTQGFFNNLNDFYKS
jgi:hypothetical protein